MPTSRLVIAVGVLTLPLTIRTAAAVDVPVTAVKLIVVDKTASSGSAKAAFTVKDSAVTKGTGTDAADIAAVLQVAYDGVHGQFAMPKGGGWLANSASVAKYVNKLAPSGGAVKVGVIKPAMVLKVVAKSMGDDPIDISQAPSGAVSVAHTVTNGAETIRHCSTFAGCTHKAIAGGSGWKLVCKAGTPDSACLGFVPPVCGDGVLAAGESCDPPGSTCGTGLLCDGSCRCHVCGNGAIEDGEQCDDGGTAAGDGCDALCQLEETASGTTSVTTDTENDGATEADPVETTVSAPVPGTIVIEETAGTGEPPAGLSLLGHQILITAPIASPAAPLVLDFLLDHSLVGDLAPGAIIVFRNGIAVADCTGSPTEALPDPCVASRVLLPGNDVQITVRTSQASPWGFGAHVAFALTSTAPVGICGAVKHGGGAGGTVVKSLTCGGLNVGGGHSTFVEAGFRSGGQTQLNGTCDDTSCVVSGRSAAETGSSRTCSQPGCPFGPFLPVANGGTSICLAHTFTAPPSGTIDHAVGSFTGSLPLAAAVYLTANAASPCPRCLGGALGVPGSGTCDPAWTSGAAASYPNAGAGCTPVDVAGSTYDCAPPPATLLPALPIPATSVTTGSAVLSWPTGIFCPGQDGPGAFGCSGSGVSSIACPGGNAPPAPDHIEVTGAAAGPITPGPHPIRLASAFCVPSVGGSLGFLINAAADLPGPGVLTLPQTIDVFTVTTSTSTTLLSTTSTSTSSTTLPPGSSTRLRLVTGAAGGSCGSLRSGGSGGTVRKILSCGGLNVGGGFSTLTEAPLPAGSLTQLHADCSPVPTCVISALSAADTGDTATCSTAGCTFGPFIPVANAGTSTCLQNTFAAPASGLIDTLSGAFTGSFPLSTAVYLTANAASPCPRCLGGSVGSIDSGSCDPAWVGGSGPSLDAGQPCTPVNGGGDTYDCAPPPAALLSAMSIVLNPLTTGVASDADPGGFFCPGQANAGAFGCAGSGSANTICPGGNTPPVPDHIQVSGLAAGAMTPGSHAMTLASSFCVPSVGGSLGFLINGAANLPGPGAVSLPAFAEIVTVTTSTSTTSSTLPPPSGNRFLLLSSGTGGSCGTVRSGGAGGAVRKTLSCGGLNAGGGVSTLAEVPVPAGGLTQLNAACTAGTCTLTASTAVDTGSNDTCSTTGCVFGPYTPVANAGTSTCLLNVFSSPAFGSLDSVSGTFLGAFPLDTNIYLTANAASPCPRCVGGTVGVVDSGACDPAWTAGLGPSPDAGFACTPVNTAGDTYDCAPPPGALLPAMSINLNPLTTGVASDSDAGGLFCPGQAQPGAFGCAGSGTVSAICPGGTAPPVPDYIAVNGTAAGFMSPGAHPITLASTFCIPSVSGTSAFLVNAAVNLPGPGAISLPAMAELAP